MLIRIRDICAAFACNCAQFCCTFSQALWQCYAMELHSKNFRMIYSNLRLFSVSQVETRTVSQRCTCETTHLWMHYQTYSGFQPVARACQALARAHERTQVSIFLVLGPTHGSKILHARTRAQIANQHLPPVLPAAQCEQSRADYALFHDFGKLKEDSLRRDDCCSCA